MTKRGYVEVTSKFDMTGPFFQGDPKKKVRANISDFLDKVSGAMEEDVRSSIAGHAGSMPYYDGWSWARTIGRRRSGRTGRTWALWAVVSANTEGGDPRVGMLNDKDAIRTKAAAAGRRKDTTSKGRYIGTAPGIETRWHPYRNSTRAARRMLRSLDLTKGLE